MYKYFALLLTFVLLTACSPTKVSDKADGKSLLRYATLLTMEESDSFCTATIANPWRKGDYLARYVLVPKERPIPSQLPEGIVLRTPLQGNALTTSVHLALLSELGALEQVSGVADTAYIVSQELKDYLRRHTEVKYLGASMQPNAELYRAASAKAVWVSPFENAGNGVLERMGLPLIQCADYMETSPLARAEWVRFYGRLVGKGREADSLFAAVESKYNTLKKRAAEQPSKQRPTVMCDLRTGAVWYQPGGNSTMGQLIADAGGRYLWADRHESGSIPLNMESVYKRAHNADIWLVKCGAPQSLTYAMMQHECPQYAAFAAWKNRKVFVCNTLTTPFYETVPFHPELLLQDFADIFCGRTQELHYYKPL